MPTKAVMVLGTTSAAGKSWLATGLCRWYARLGLRVAPFKAQNMSNNARVVPAPDGRPGEIGSAQYFQALAARTMPDVRMNPILLKPERDTSSQVVVWGRVRGDYARLPWRERSELLWPHARRALHSLMAENDVLVIEGAGSPAEINLRSSDYTNMRTAREADARCLLVTDIDRGGAFAHLFGTYQLLEPAERALVRGFVLNRFRGDVGLLAPGPAELRSLTGIPTLAVLPLWQDHSLPEEDGVFDDAPTGGLDGLRIAIVAYPRVSNLDEFQPLRNVKAVRLTWARHPGSLAEVDWIILPGSKHTTGDLAWLRERGLADAISRHAAAGRPVLGICGGLQMLGESLSDPDGVDGNAQGLGLLPLATRFSRDKLLRSSEARFTGTSGPWSSLTGVRFCGYEIRHGGTTAETAGEQASVYNELGEIVGWQKGSVLGLYVHGLFESPALRALFGTRAFTLDSTFDGLANFIDHHFDPGALAGLIAP
jgi:adenosylcobyric acid synthase